MPVYEEKLLCPLAIRFTQSHIRSAFRDGRDVEASCAEVTARPGTGEYDVILEAPFPTVEIVRWAPGHRSCGSSRCGSRSDALSESDPDSGSDDPDDDRWFTYDNRRLYCLQRAALQHWPKRVGAVVQVMYASNRNMLKRKFDSPSLGREVDIMRMGEDVPYTTFNWRKAARPWRSPAAALVLDAALADEGKRSVAELQDAPQAANGLERMLAALAQEEEDEQRKRQVEAQATAAAKAAVQVEAVAAQPRAGAKVRRFQGRGRRAAAAPRLVSAAA